MKNIKIINCTKKFAKNNNEIIALNKINYSFKSNNFYAIMGESGSGKSTLINILSGLLKMDEGSIELDSEEIKSKDFPLIRNKNIGLVYQSFLLNDNLTALENVMLPLFLNKKLKYKQKVEKAKNILISLGLKERMNHYPKELSGGEQQRVAIARALINNPDIILADEPTGNLDKKNEKYIFNLFRQLANDNKCVIVVSHNEAIKEFADTVLIIKEGVLLENKE